MSELKRKLEQGLISVDDGVLDLKWNSITLELGDDKYLQCLGVLRIIKGGVDNPRGLLLPNVESLYYWGSERIVLPEIVKHLGLLRRTDRELVLSRYIPSIYIHSRDRQLEVFDVRCDYLELYDTLFNEYLYNVGHSRCSENYYLLKMGVCLN